MAFNYNSNNITSVNWNGNSVSTVNFNGTQVWGSAPPVVIEPFYIQNRDNSNSITAKLYKTLTAPSVSLESSTDKATWTTYVAGTDITVPAGGKMYFRAPENMSNTTFAQDDSKFNTWTASGPYDIGGDLTTLLVKDGGLTSLSGYGYYGGQVFFNLFGSWNNSGTNKVVDASNLLLLPDTLGRYCYKYMFYNDTNLIGAPALPATDLKDYCYQSMFQGCTSLTRAPALPATTLKQYCYGSMFYGCTSLEVPPALPALTVADYAYSSMFTGCTSLAEAPSLPATTIGPQAYSYMFKGCTALKVAPALPCTTLSNGCYYEMFRGCTSLKSAYLPAPSLVNQTYYCMFYGCSALQNLKADFTAWNDANYATYRWLYNVDPYILKLELPDALGNDLTITHDISHVPENCVVENSSTYNLPLTFSVEDVSSLVGTYPALTLQAHGNPGYTPELQYNINGGAWTDYTIGDTLYTTNAQIGDYIQFRAKTTNSAFSTSGNDGYTFVAEDGKFKVFGNIQSLLDKDMLSDSVPSNAFYGLFMSFNGNVGHVRCPATTLGTWCYAGLFRANADHNFKRAFTDFPALYASERCYQTVYYDDAYLKYIPHFACTSGGSNCFMRTFQNCTSLDVEYFCIPFSSLAYRQCYEMFLNAGTIHKFELLATDIGYDRCLNSIFSNANPLHIKVYITDWQWDSGYPTDNWVNNVNTDTSDCIFECPAELGTQSTINRGSAYCPTNWTVINF